MSILYEFSNDLRTRNVLFPWVDGLDTLKAGTPLDINGAIVNDDTAVGIVAEDVPRNWGRLIARDGNFYADVQVIVAGYIDEAAAEASCGLTYTDALKGKLSDIVFADGKVSFGESGGGSEPTKTYYVPEQTVSLTDYGNFSAYVLTNVTLNAQSGTPSTITLSVDGTTEELTNEGAGWTGENYRIDDADDIWRLYPRSASPSSSVTVSAYAIEESGGGGGVDYLPFGYTVENMSSESGTIVPIIPYAFEQAGVTYLAADLAYSAPSGTPYLSTGDLAVPYVVTNLTAGTTPSLVASSDLPPEGAVTIVAQSFDPSTQKGYALVHLEPATYEGNTFYWLGIKGHFETT